jgi:hypothetical protein
MKKNDAVFAWQYLRIQPLLTSLIICSTDEKAKSTFGV